MEKNMETLGKTVTNIDLLYEYHSDIILPSKSNDCTTCRNMP
jgi:hypothetical protein